jgi:hypothetical protein
MEWYSSAQAGFGRFRKKDVRCHSQNEASRSFRAWQGSLGFFTRSMCLQNDMGTCFNKN